MLGDAMVVCRRGYGGVVIVMVATTLAVFSVCVVKFSQPSVSSYIFALSLSFARARRCKVFLDKKMPRELRMVAGSFEGVAWGQSSHTQYQPQQPSAAAMAAAAIGSSSST
jgi:hypothetical protein